MGMPIIKGSDTKREQAITDVIESVALEGAAVAHIINAEGEKIQKFVASDCTLDLLLEANKSVEEVLKTVTNFEGILRYKLDYCDDSGYYSKELFEIKITALPTKTSYIVGDKLDLTDLTVVGTYVIKEVGVDTGDRLTKVEKDYTVVPENSAVLLYPGTIDVTVSLNNKNAVFPVVVREKDINVTDISVSPATDIIHVGGQLTLTATVLPANATNKEVLWASSDKSAATVSDGIVTALKPCTVTITAETVNGSKKSDSSIKVVDANQFVNNGIYSVTTNYLLDLTFVVVAVDTPASSITINGGAAVEQSDKNEWRYTLDGTVSLPEIAVAINY